MVPSLRDSALLIHLPTAYAVGYLNSAASRLHRVIRRRFSVSSSLLPWPTELAKSQERSSSTCRASTTTASATVKQMRECPGSRPQFALATSIIYGRCQPINYRLLAVPKTDDRHSYCTISEIVPAPTVCPPSRMAKRKPFSIATGVISSITSCTLSPGITISVPEGSSATPVTSVVRK